MPDAPNRSELKFAALLEDVEFQWPGQNRFNIYVERFALAPGERLLLLGPSGGGKSTLLNLMAGVVAPDQGRVVLLGQDITQLSSTAKDKFRAEHLGIVFQMFNLLPYGSVLDNIVLPLSFSSVRKKRAGTTTVAIKSEAARLLTALGLDDSGLLDSPVGTLSVGQQQRVAAARALIGSPEIILADEPTSSLDRKVQQGFLELLFAQLTDTKSSMVMVSHDETMAQYFDRSCELKDVVKLRDGSSKEL